MKTIDNYVKLIGNLGQDVEVLEFKNGSKLGKFSLATNDYYRNKEGEWVSNTYWHNLVVNGYLVDKATEKLKKGNTIVVEGSIANRSYETKDGTKRYITEIKVRDFRKLTRDHLPVQ